MLTKFILYLSVITLLLFSGLRLTSITFAVSTDATNCQTDNTCDNSKPEPCSNGTGIQTAFGCIPTVNNLLDPKNAIADIARFAIGIGGAVALGIMIAGAYKMITSGGNPEAVTAGRQQFISAIIGLLFVIFAFTLLNVIANTILNLPGG